MCVHWPFSPWHDLVPYRAWGFVFLLHSWWWERLGDGEEGFQCSSVQVSIRDMKLFQYKTEDAWKKAPEQTRAKSISKLRSFSWLAMLSREHEEKSFQPEQFMDILLKRTCFVICKINFPLHCLWFFVHVLWLKPLVSERSWWQSGGGRGHSCPSLSPQQTWQKRFFGWGTGWAAGGGMSSSAAWRLRGLSSRALGWHWKGWDSLWARPQSWVTTTCCRSQGAWRNPVSQPVWHPSVTSQCHSPMSQPSVTARQHTGLCKDCHYLFWGVMVQITATTPREAPMVQKHESLFACFALLFLPGLCGLYLYK